MKHLHIILPALLLAILATSCEKDPELQPTTFTLAIHPKVGNQPMVLAQEAVDQENYRIRPTLLKFYLSHIKLTTSDGNNVEIADVVLMDMENLEAGEPMVFKIEVPDGSYTGIDFWVGLDSVQNYSDPNTFNQEHPLSLFSGTYWTWNTGYRFVMLEGYFDTLPNTPGPVDATRFFNYHTGINSLYRQAVLGSASQPFSIGEGESYVYNIDLDLNKLWYGAQAIPRNQGATTHTTSNYELAEKFTENFVRAFSLSTP